MRVVVPVQRTTTINDLKIKAANSYNALLRRIYQTAKEQAIKGESAMEKGSLDGAAVVDVVDTSSLVGTIGVQIPDLLFSNTLVIDLGGERGMKKILDET